MAFLGFGLIRKPNSDLFKFGFQILTSFLNMFKPGLFIMRTYLKRVLIKPNIVDFV